MQDEAEKPTTKSRGAGPGRIDLLLLGTVWALFAATLFAGLRIWSGGSH